MLDRLGVQPGRGAAEQSVWGGFGEALSQAIELVGAPILFALAGVWLDDRFGTRPILTVVLAVLGVTGVLIRAFYAYHEKVRADDEGKPWARR